MLRDDQPFETLAQRLGIELLVRNALAQNLIVIGREAYRRRAEIEVLFEGFLGRGSTGFAQRMPDGERQPARSRTDSLDQLLVHGLIEQLLDGAARQLEALGEV